MKKLLVKGNLFVDDIDAVMEGIMRLSGNKTICIETIVRFISEEKNTVFYLDSKMNCNMTECPNSIYAWLDSGVRTANNIPIFISLLKMGEIFIGHYVGTSNILANVVKSYFKQNVKLINQNIGSFNSKYQKKCEARAIKYIEDENTYLLAKCNQNFTSGALDKVISDLNYECPASDFVPENILSMEDTINETVVEKNVTFTKKEEAITIEILLNQMEKVQEYVKQLEKENDELRQESNIRNLYLDKLKKENEEIKQSLVQIREYNMVEMEEERKNVVSSTVHDLLMNRKILVLGDSSITINDMNGIGKIYGFEKSDFDYEMDYKKVKAKAGRIVDGGKYKAVLIACSPHKVKALGEYTSLVEKLKAYDDVICVKAQTKAGGFKLTKEAYKVALKDIYSSLTELNSFNLEYC